MTTKKTTHRAHCSRGRGGVWCDCGGKKAPKMPLTRKRKPVAGSILAFTMDYQGLGFPLRQAEALAQLAYTQKRILKRLDAVEAVELARIFGMVSIGRDLHLLDCAKRDDKTNECTCGATPPGASKETRG